MIFNEEVAEAIVSKKPIVALESTVIAHGLPFPQNLETAKSLEKIVRENGAIPATIAVFGGEFCVGLSDEQIETLATDKTIRKISRRDLPIVTAKKMNCATTVATTMYIAHRAGIKVFSTGGIGGVHRGFPADVSADLPELAQTPMTVVCSGAKIVLDLPRTREWLETNGVTILGYQCNELPAFYSRKSGLETDERCESAKEISEIIKSRDQLGLKNAVLVTVPVPENAEVPPDVLNKILTESLELAAKHGISGKEVTPFLLSRMSELSKGDTLKANISLLENNARIATKISVELSKCS
jgi:pseudouridylate synthase